MCGINGLFSIGTPLPVNTEALIRQMNATIAHRGPDDSGIFFNPDSGIALGHQRLSIIDLSPAGHQPMMDESKNVIVFNGEIYNYNELKSSVKDKFYHSQSDTRVLMGLLKEQALSALHSLNGMFAFAWFNHQTKELSLARDRVGKKPIYYSTTNGIFAFSSEIKSLLTLPWIKSEIDQDALYNFLTFNQLDAPQTMFRNISKFAPAESMVVNANGIKEKKIWWSPEYNLLSDKSESEIAGEIFTQLENSVKQRMVSDVPVGAFLSGGVDSSAVVALMRRNSDAVIKTFSVGFKNQPDYDERIYAGKISKMFNTEHHEKIVSPEDISGFLSEVVNVFDEPMADATCIPIYFISKLARENNTIVVQTGDGADELFAGYNSWIKYNALYPAFNNFTRLPELARQGVASVYNTLSTDSPVAELINRGKLKQELFWGGAKAFKEVTKRKFLQPSFLDQLTIGDSYSIINEHRNKFREIQKLNPKLNHLDWMCYLGLKFQIPNKYLFRMDRLGMANSIEIRSPFLDYNLVNLALSIPSKFKIKNEVPKYILKKSLEPILPKEILYRKKMGFCVPLQEWSGPIMVDFIEQNLREFCRNTGIFKEAELKIHVDEIKKGNKNYTNNLWTVFFLMNWFKKWM